MAKFESHIFQISENMDVQSLEILQTFVCWGMYLYPPPGIQLESCLFANIFALLWQKFRQETANETSDHVLKATRRLHQLSLITLCFLKVFLISSAYQSMFYQNFSSTPEWPRAVFLRSTKWNTSLILTCGFRRVVVMWTFICWNKPHSCHWRHQNGHPAWVLQGYVTASKLVPLLRRDEFASL